MRKISWLLIGSGSCTKSGFKTTKGFCGLFKIVANSSIVKNDNDILVYYSSKFLKAPFSYFSLIVECLEIIRTGHEDLTKHEGVGSEEYFMLFCCIFCIENIESGSSP